MRRGKVLISESDERLLLSWTRGLSREGYSVTGASSIKEAVQACKKQSYELLVIRVEEPGLLNMALTQFPPGMGVLIVTTEAAASRVVEYCGAGVHSFLIKPFTLRKFKEAVNQAIDRTRSIEESFRVKTLTMLEQANSLFSSGIKTNQLCRLAVEMGAAGTGADYVSLAVKDETTSELTVHAEQGDYQPSWKVLCQEVMETGKPILIDEATQGHARLHRLMTEVGISALLCMPLVVKGDVIGAMNHIKVSGGAKFVSSDLNLASILASWSSIAIENVRLFDRVQKQRLHVEELLQEIAHVQDNERRRVAIQIHDGVAQWMVGASYSIKACSTLISESKLAELELELHNIERTLQRSVKELRRAIANLRPLPLEEVGLIDAIFRQIQALSEDGIRCHAEVQKELPELSFAEENTTYWIIQEILTNIRNHSKASDVYLRIESSETTFSVEITDNGQGFNPDEVLSSAIALEHMGLLGMQERAKLLGGNLTINSKPGQGTTIGFMFPVSSRVVMKTMA
jgi:signal transduction histidine kinase